MSFMLNNLPEDILFYQIQPFIGNEFTIYFNKYVKEFRVKFCKNNALYKKLNELFADVNIIYNKSNGGSVIEIGGLKTKSPISFLLTPYKFAITHIVYTYKNTLVVYTELCRKIEYYDLYDCLEPDERSFMDIPYTYYKTWYNHSSNTRYRRLSEK